MDENEGIKAIIFLQSMAGIDESEEDAKKGWRGLSEAEREKTMEVYAMLKNAGARVL